MTNYDPKKAPVVKYLLILEPFTLNDEYYFISDIWEKYLKKTYPQHLNNIHIITIGLRDCNNSNYLALDNMPINFKEDFLQHVLPLSKLNSEIYNDILSNSKDITNMIVKLFKGHGEYNFIGTLNYLVMSTDIIDNSLNNSLEFKNTLKNIYPIAKSQWHIFLYRWKNYQHYLKVCPFPLDNVPILIDQLELLFANENPSQSEYQEANCTENLKKIRIQFLDIKSLVSG